MTISIIAALSRNRVIGKDGDLPWKLPADMQFFKATTTDHHVVLGRKNYESIPEKYRPLPNRTNIILSRNPDLAIQGCITVSTLQDAVDLANSNKEGELFIIGGGEVYKLALPIAQKMYLTEIRADIEGDVFFPEFDKSEWRETSRIHHVADEKHNYAFDFVTYDKR